MKRSISEDIGEALFELSSIARARGAKELFLGHPSPNCYCFSADGVPFQGSLNSRVVEQLRIALAPQRRALLRSSHSKGGILALGLVDLANFIIYLTWPDNSAPRQQSSTPHRSSHVLLLDDEPHIAELVAAVLRRGGFVVTYCRTIEDAQMTLTESPAPIDLLISDLHLPGGGVRQFLSALRTNGATLPILLLTAECESDQLHSAIESGIDAYLWKGSDPELLLAWARNLTAPHRTRRFNL